MHSNIVQIATEPIASNNYLNGNTLEIAYNPVDYVYEISEEDRKEFITDLVEKFLPKGMFSLADDGSIIYNGGIEEWKKQWVATIRETANKLTADNIFTNPCYLYDTKKCLWDALDLGTLFYLSPENYQSYAEKSTIFMSYVDSLMPGTKLYVGGVLGYHY